MPVPLVSKEEIPKLARQVNSPAILRVLRHLQERDFIHNGPGIDELTATTLKRLVELGLADPGYARLADDAPFIWVGNGNGKQVLQYLEEHRPYKIKVNARAKTALDSLSEEEREEVLGAVEALLIVDAAFWPSAKAAPLNQDNGAYSVSVSSDLRAFIRILDPGVVELFDVVREDTLRKFLERQRAGGKV
jgi:hypothetical protein